MCITIIGCTPPMNVIKKEPEIMPMKWARTPLPEPAKGKVVVAVYSFADKTGQRKDSATIAKLSSAVTQGGETVLLKSLEDAGDGKWFCAGNSMCAGPETAHVDEGTTGIADFDQSTDNVAFRFSQEAA